MLNIVLYCPEIPQNTGNIGRLCAVTQSRLHLIYPLGFSVDEKAIRRSGMDYWQALDVCHHESWDAFVASPERPERLWLFTTKATKTYWDTNFQDGDGLLFGNEGHGAPDAVHAFVGNERRITIPHYNEAMRSLNLATSAGIACYEALRQINAAG